MEIWDFQGQNSDKELVFHLGTHINVRIFNRVHVSKHWLYQITWSIFGNLVLPQVSQRELIPFERWIHRHSSGKAFGPRDWSNTFYNTKVWFLFAASRRNLLPPPLGAHPRALSPTLCYSQNPGWGRSSVVWEGPWSRDIWAGWQLPHPVRAAASAFEGFDSALKALTLSVNWQFKEGFVNIKSFLRYIHLWYPSSLNPHLFFQPCVSLLCPLIFASRRIVFFPFLHLFWLTKHLSAESQCLCLFCAQIHIQKVFSLPSFFLYVVSILSGESIPLFSWSHWMYR